MLNIDMENEKKLRNKTKLEIHTDTGTVISIEHDGVYYNAHQMGEIVGKNIEEWVDLETTYKLITEIEKTLKKYDNKFKYGDSKEKVYFYKYSAYIWVHNLLLKDLARWLGDPILSGVNKHLLHLTSSQIHFHKKYIPLSFKHDDIEKILHIQNEQLEMIKKLETEIKNAKRERKELYSRDICQQLCIML